MNTAAFQAELYMPAGHPVYPAEPPGSHAIHSRSNDFAPCGRDPGGF